MDTSFPTQTMNAMKGYESLTSDPFLSNISVSSPVFTLFLRFTYVVDELLILLDSRADLSALRSFTL